MTIFVSISEFFTANSDNIIKNSENIFKNGANITERVKITTDEYNFFNVSGLLSLLESCQRPLYKSAIKIRKEECVTM